MPKVEYGCALNASPKKEAHHKIQPDVIKIRGVVFTYLMCFEIYHKSVNIVKHQKY